MGRIARSRGSRSLGTGSRSAAPVQPVQGINFDRKLAEFDAKQRGFSSSTALGSDFAGQRVAEVAQDAQREVDRILRAQSAGRGINEARLAELQGIAATGIAPGKQTLFGKLLSAIDKPAAVVRLGIADLLDADGRAGVSIGAGDYLDIFLGKTDRLRANLGTDVVGQDARVSGSQILTLAGHDTSDTRFSAKFTRGLASFGVEVLTDPLTYLATGAKGISASVRATLALKSVDDAARAGKALSKVDDLGAIVRSGADEADQFARRLGTDIAEEAQTIRRDLIDEFVATQADDVVTDTLSMESLFKGSFGGATGASTRAAQQAVVDATLKAKSVELSEVALEQATKNVSTRAAKPVLQAAVSKDFGVLALREAADSVYGTRLLKGGIQFAAPLYRRQLSKIGLDTGIVPGTRGLGKKVTRALFGTSKFATERAGARGILPLRRGLDSGPLVGFQTRWEGWADKLSSNQHLRGIGRGTVDNPAALLRLKSEMLKIANEIGGGQALDTLRGLEVKISTLADSGGIAAAELDDLTRTMGAMIELGDINSSSAFEDWLAANLGRSVSSLDPQVVNAVREYGYVFKQAIDNLSTQAVDAGILQGGLSNYLPHVVRGETRTFLDDAVRLEAEVTGDSLGDQMLRQIFENHKLQRSVDTTDTVLGETRFAQERVIGRTAIEGQGQEVIPAMIGDTVLHGRQFEPGSMTVEQLNEALLEAMTKLSDDTAGLNLPKLKFNAKLKFTPYETNPLITSQIYLRDMSAAILERRMIGHLQEVGLVDDGVKFINQQRLASELAGKVGKYGSDAVAEARAKHGAFLEEKLTALKSLRELDEVPVTRIEIAPGYSVDIPDSAIAANRKLANRIAKLNDDTKVRAEVERRARAFFEDTKRALIKEGAPEPVAERMALAWSTKSLGDMLKEARATLRRQALDESVVLKTALATSDASLVTAKAVLNEIDLQWGARISDLDSQRRALDGIFRERLVASSVKHVEAPLTSSAALRPVTREIQSRTVKDINDLAEELLEQGNDDVAALLRDMAVKIGDDASLIPAAQWEEVEAQIRGVAQVWQQMDEFVDVENAQRIKHATSFVNQGFDEVDRYIVSGHAGSFTPGDVNYVYHGSSNPTAFESLSRGEWYGGGITASPWRARNYAGTRSSGTVSVWRVEDLGLEAEAMLRAGTDIEDAESLSAIWRQGGGSGPLPAPVAVFEEDVWKEALRVSTGPEPVGFRFAEDAGAQRWYDTLADTIPQEKIDEVFPRGLQDVMPWYRATIKTGGEAVAVEGGALATFFDIAADEGERMARELDRVVKESVDNYNAGFDFSNVADSTPQYKADPARKAVLSHWRDKHAPTAGVREDIVPVGQPMHADWLPGGPQDLERITPGSRVSHTVQHPYTYMIDNEDKAVELFLDPRSAQQRFVRDAVEGSDEFNAAIAAHDRPINADLIHGGFDERPRSAERIAAYTDRAGLASVTSDLTEASRHSLISRGLGDEFPVWSKGYDDETGKAIVSLSPIDDAEVFLVNRTSVDLDFGIFQRPGQPAGAMRDKLIVNAEGLNRPLASAAEYAKSGRALPTKTQLHLLRPSTISREYIRQFFPNDEIADLAYQDLVDRLSLVWSASRASDERRFAMLMSSDTVVDTTRPFPALASQDPVSSLDTLATDGQFMGGLASFQSALDDSNTFLPESNVFTRPDMQEWFADEVDKTLGMTVRYANVWVLDGKLVPRGSRGAVEVTVPVIVDSVEQAPTVLSRTGFERGLDAQGVTAATARSHVRWFDEFADEAAAEAGRKLARYQEAKQFVDNADEKLVNTARGMTNEVVDDFDLYRGNLATNQAADGRLRQTKETLLGRRAEAEILPSEEISDGIVTQLERAAASDSPGVSIISPRSGEQAVSGHAVGAWADSSLRVKVPRGGVSAEFFTDLRLEISRWVDNEYADLSRGRAHVLAYQDGNEMVVELAANTHTRAEALQLGLSEDATVMFSARTGLAENIPKTRRAATRAVKLSENDKAAFDILDQVESALRGNNTKEAFTLLEGAANRRVLQSTMDPIDFDNLSEMVKTEFLIGEKIVPQVNALRAQRAFIKTMSNRQTAYESVIRTTEDAVAAVGAATTKEVERMYQAEVRFTELMSEIMGVGPAELGGKFRDPSLYPKASRIEGLTPSEFRLAQLKEAENIAKELGWDMESKALKEVFDNPPWDVLPKRGKQQHSARVFGVGGSVTTYQSTDIWTAGLLENLVRNWQSLNTPKGMGMFAKEARWIARAWKSMATVARPNFHIRNFVGAAWNNQIADVGVVDYAWVRNRMMKVARLQKKGLTQPEILAEFKPRDAEIIGAMFEHEVLTTGFSQAEFGGGTAFLEKGVAAKAKRGVNIGKGTDPLSRGGGFAMRTIEDFMRAAAFTRWFDELGAEGASAMSRGVHFDYTDLTKLDEQIKRFVPFWIWSKNNIPLQMRAAYERPDLLAKYSHLMHSVNDNGGGEHDAWPAGPFMSDIAADTGFEFPQNDGATWMRLLFDPDLPVKDLEVLGNPLSFDTWTSLAVNIAGPHVSSPFRFNEQQQWGKTNAPTGLNEILKGLSFLPGIGPEQSAQGDVQVGFGTKNLFNTAFPILNEYTQLTGLVNDPNQEVKLGISGEPSIGERLRGVGLQLAKGIGLQPSTPQDARGRAFVASERVREIVDELKLSGVLTPEDFNR